MSVFDAFLSGYQNDAQAPSGEILTPVASAGQQGADRTILDILAALGSAKTTAPPPQADLTGIPGLALARFAAQVMQPRDYGQSTAAKVVASGANALEYADSLKREAESRAAQQALNQQKLAQGELAIQGGKLDLASNAMRLKRDQEKAPLELQALQQSIKNAASAGELTNLNLRLSRIKEKYADEMAKAEVEEKNANSEHRKAQAARDRALAEKNMALIDAQLAELDAKKKAAQKAQMKHLPADVVTGMPDRVELLYPGEAAPRVHYYDEGGASMAAQAITAQLKGMAEKLGQPFDEKKVLAQQQEIARKKVLQDGAIPGQVLSVPKGETPAAPGKGYNVPKDIPPEDAPTYSEAQSASRGGKAATAKLEKSGTTHYFYDGREVSASEFQKLRLKGQGGGASITPAPQTELDPSVQMGHVPGA